jgi:HPt (histidine-containing phosphotransfer) domain-containing protein
LDKNIALSRVGGDAELLREIARLFLAEYPATLCELKRAAAAEDGGALERHAHSLKGSVSTFADGDVIDAALALEEKGRRGALDGVDEDLWRLETELERLRPELEAL